MNKLISIAFLVFISIAHAEPNISIEQHNKEVLEYGQSVINSAGHGLECSGIEMFDTGAAMDMPIVFADAKTRKVICVWSFGDTTIADPKINNKCPPVEWESNGCVEKQKENYRIQRERMNAK